MNMKSRTSPKLKFIEAEAGAYIYMPITAPVRGFLFSSEFFERIGGLTKAMEKRVAIIGIIVERDGMVDKLNELLHEYGEHIIGRMGLPHRERGISIISLAVDAPQDVISALGGKIGRLPGISSKTLYSNS